MWTRVPAPIPSAATMPARRPSATPRAVTYIMSGPGVRFSASAAAMKSAIVSAAGTLRRLLHVARHVLALARLARLADLLQHARRLFLQRRIRRQLAAFARRKPVLRARGVPHEKVHIDEPPAQRHMIDAVRLAECRQPALEQVIPPRPAKRPPRLEMRRRHAQQQRLVRPLYRQCGERTVGEQALQD